MNYKGNGTRSAPPVDTGKILLTGADGFLGSNITRELISRGYSVRAFIHPESTSTTLDGLNLERYKGNLLDAESIERAARDVDAIIHAAASTKIWPTHSKANASINIEGTKNVIRAVQKQQLHRLVYVGSASSFGPGTKQNPGHEQKPYTSNKYRLGYLDSKYKAHNEVMKAVKKNGLPAVIVNPTFMFGPYDSGPSSGAMILAVYHEKVPGYTPGGRNYISVKAAAKGICNALTKGKTGECYILGNQNLSYKEAFDLIATTIGAKAPNIKLPRFAILSYGLASSFAATLFQNQPTVSFPMAKIACDEHYYSAEKASRELQLPQIPVSEAIQEAFQWFTDNNKL